MKRPLRRQSRKHFRQRDVQRAVRSAEAAGLEVGTIEVVTAEGITIRVSGRKARPDIVSKIDADHPRSP